MAANKGLKEDEDEFVYRISTAEEWAELQTTGATFGGDLDKSTACFHLSKLDQVQSTLQRFFMNIKEDLYLLQIGAKKLGDGLFYESVDESNSFPHFYGPSRSFSPLPLDAVIKAEESVIQQCTKKPVIFNFGDSNSDTGGLSAAMGYEFGYPDGRAFFPKPTGRLCDGRLVIDFLCEHLKTNYLTPYLESVEPDFSNGVNFAISGSATLPRSVPFNLDVQVLEFYRFYKRSLEFQSKGVKNLVDEEGFKNAQYMIDIGQNDLAAAFNSLSYPQVIEKIPSFISQIRGALWAMYERGGRKFWVHNTGPLGCLPKSLATVKSNTTEFDAYGCIEPMNQGAKAFNAELSALCQQLRSQMQNATIVYVDVYAIKYNLIANSASYGFKHPLMACCGHGGMPYNYDPTVNCLAKGYSVCRPESRSISWDGVHYTQAANAIVAYHILSTNHSTPPLAFNFFCNTP